MSVEVTRLENGLTIVTDSMPHLQTTSVGVWVNTGARHESVREHGVSHMLEHMAFKGTERRSALAIAEEIETVGGHLNAHTTHEATAYYARVLRQDLPLAVDILSDILQNSVFDPEEVERERGVIISEIGQAHDTPDDVVFDDLLEAAYPGQPLGRSILGTVDTVSAFSRDELQGYMGQRYLAPGMVLAAAGGLEHEQLVRLARERFGDLPRRVTNGAERAVFSSGERRKDRDLEQVHLALAFEGPTYGDPDYYTAQVFSGVLGGGMSSRLFQEVREKRGLCYSVFAFSWSFADTGVFGLYAGTAPDHVAELMPVLSGEMGRIGEDATEEETARARAQIKAGLLMGLESSSSRAEQIARQYMIHGRVLPIDELVAKVDAVDAAAVRRYAGRLLSGPGLALSAIGPLAGKDGGLESYDRIAARFTH
ncbi:peptidase M16 domain protein [Parvibaculum lavamentivorans DS-1]|uniref:Peptidase M16 domain protein n=1 Tax=Parvibaculum lavamentivorans (strain DS-1 / DSM 13023 / NCIMB 13966) TaxID=402881 RepID=A7HQW8_PARL1|nr:pitrilysin family protein [Parvibaculum lavamentivorans]ABS62301.1 peptidase M16 domain protein [Parvibaculum lavamentivorans DS-1]